MIRLDRALREQRALSVYVDGTLHDPAARHAWRKKLEQNLQEIRSRLQASNRGEVDAFERAARRIQEPLGSFEAAIPAAGWVGFATADALHHAGAVAAPVPDLAWWGRGIRVAPYVRALKQHRPVVAALVDSRRARLFTYHAGELKEVADLRVDTFLGDLSDVFAGGRTSGVRGLPTADVAERNLLVALDRMLKDLARQVGELADADAWIVLGGTPEVVKAAADHLADRLRGRLLEQTSLEVTASNAAVRDAVQAAAHTLREGQQDELVGAIIDAARANGKGVVGVAASFKALEERSVERLFLTRSFMARRPDEAERAVKAAFDQDALVEETSGDAAARLETEGEGIGARLRFVVRRA